MTMKEFAWLVPHCPNFYFMPSLFYPRLFKEWDDGSRNCPAYWKSRGIPPIACYKTDDESEAQCWISKRYGKWETECHIKEPGTYNSFWTEALNATRKCGTVEEVHLLRFSLASLLVASTNSLNPVNPPSETVAQSFLLKVGDNVKVPAISVKTKDGWKYGSEVPYQHFRKHPVEPGLYVVTDIWMHPDANDPTVPSSYCYTLRRIRSNLRFTNLERNWRAKLNDPTFQKKLFSSSSVNYNCLDWDLLIKDGKVKTDVYIPGEKFNLEEFKRDLGQVLYKHKASLSVCREYDGSWDEEGTMVLRVVVGGEAKAALATEFRDFPVRRSEPTWEAGKPNR